MAGGREEQDSNFFSRFVQLQIMGRITGILYSTVVTAGGVEVRMLYCRQEIFLQKNYLHERRAVVRCEDCCEKGIYVVDSQNKIRSLPFPPRHSDEKERRSGWCFPPMERLFRTNAQGHGFLLSSYDSDAISGELLWVNLRYVPTTTARDWIRLAKKKDVFRRLHCVVPAAAMAETEGWNSETEEAGAGVNSNSTTLLSSEVADPPVTGVGSEDEKDILLRMPVGFDLEQWRREVGEWRRGRRETMRDGVRRAGKVIGYGTSLAPNTPAAIDRLQRAYWEQGFDLREMRFSSKTPRHTDYGWVRNMKNVTQIPPSIRWADLDGVWAVWSRRAEKLFSWFQCVCRVWIFFFPLSTCSSFSSILFFVEEIGRSSCLRGVVVSTFDDVSISVPVF